MLNPELLTYCPCSQLCGIYSNPNMGSIGKDNLKEPPSTPKPQKPQSELDSFLCKRHVAFPARRVKMGLEDLQNYDILADFDDQSSCAPLEACTGSHSFMKKALSQVQFLHYTTWLTSRQTPNVLSIDGSFGDWTCFWPPNKSLYNTLICIMPIYSRRTEAGLGVSWEYCIEGLVLSRPARSLLHCLVRTELKEWV